MPALPLRSCLLAALLLAPAVAGAMESVRIAEPPSAAGQPLDLAPRKQALRKETLAQETLRKGAPKAARRPLPHKSQIVHKGPAGRSALTDPLAAAEHVPADHPPAEHPELAAKAGLAEDTRSPATPAQADAAGHEAALLPAGHEATAATPGAEHAGPQAVTPAVSHPTSESATPAHEDTAPSAGGEKAPSQPTEAESHRPGAEAKSAIEVAAKPVVETPPVTPLKGSGAPAPRAAPLPPAPVLPVVIATPADPATPAGRPVPQNDTQQFCSNIAAAAADARYAWQRKQITDLQAELKGRIAELDAKQEEVKAVLARRDALMRKATETVVALYAGMKPDAAAEQIAVLDDDMAAAVLAQLPQRKASQILNQIPADKAAKLVAAIATVNPPEKKS